jgi:HSP20 family protein
MNTNMAKSDNRAMSANTGTRSRGYALDRPFGSVISSLLGKEMSQWFDDDVWGLTNRITPGSVPVNIRETDKTYEVEVMAPGLKKNDFNVSLDGKQLTISFEHKEEQKEGAEREGYLRQEYRHQSFARTFSLDDTVDANKIDATYTDGVLHLTVPKKEEAQRIVRNVEVK